MKVDPKPSRRFGEYVRKIVCDEWESLGMRGGDQGLLRHTSGVVVSYLTHDGGNDWNGPRNFAAAVQRVCGCRLIEPRGRKQSRKPPPGDELAPARARHAIDFEVRLGAQQAERAALRQRKLTREEDIRLTEAEERRRRFYERLMQSP